MHPEVLLLVSEDFKLSCAIRHELERVFPNVRTERVDKPDEALHKIIQLSPKVAIVDVRLRQMKAFTLIDDARQVTKGIAIIMLVKDTSFESQILARGFADEVIPLDDVRGLIQVIDRFINISHVPEGNRMGRELDSPQRKDRRGMDKEYVNKEVHKAEHATLNKYVKDVDKKASEAQTTRECGILHKGVTDDIRALSTNFKWVVVLIVVNILVVIGVGLILNSTNSIDQGKLDRFKQSIEAKIDKLHG